MSGIKLNKPHFAMLPCVVDQKFRKKKKNKNRRMTLKLGT